MQLFNKFYFLFLFLIMKIKYYNFETLFWLTWFEFFHYTFFHLNLAAFHSRIFIVLLHSSGCFTPSTAVFPSWSFLFNAANARQGTLKDRLKWNFNNSIDSIAVDERWWAFQAQRLHVDVAVWALGNVKCKVFN